MQNTYEFDYLDEEEFKKRERAVRKYNMLAYKKLMFEYYPELHKGKFLGKEVSRNDNVNFSKYELTLPTDSMFAKVHGEMVLHYTVYKEKGIIVLTNITPDEILGEGNREVLSTYKGVMVSKNNAAKDMFKINLLNMLGGSSSSSNNSKKDNIVYTGGQYERCSILLSEIANLERKKKSLELLKDNFDDMNNEIENELYNKINEAATDEVKEFFQNNKINNLKDILSIYVNPTPPEKKKTFNLCAFVVILIITCFMCDFNKITLILWIIILLLSVYVGIIHVNYYSSDKYKLYVLRKNVYNFLYYNFSIPLFNYGLVSSAYKLKFLEENRRNVSVSIQEKKEMVKKLLKIDSYDEEKIGKILKENKVKFKFSSKVYDNFINDFNDKLKFIVNINTVCSLDGVKEDIDGWISNL